MLDAFQPKEVAIVAVTRESFVATFSRKQYLDVAAGQLRDEIHGNSGRFTNRLFHVPDVLGHESGEIRSRYGHFMMPTSECFRCELRIRPLIDDTRVGKPYG